MSFNKIFTAVVVVGIIVAGFFYFKNNPKNMTDNNKNQGQETQTDVTGTPSDDTKQNQSPEEVVTPLPDKVMVSIDVKDFGLIELELDTKAAPKTVANFVKLAKEEFYNGLKFHRIVQGFMIQGGDPKGDGTGGPGYNIPPEIGLKHTKGAIAMARTSGPAATTPSSGSQFYITLDVQTFLDGQYTVFGYVKSGMDVVEKIGATPVDANPMSGEMSDPIKDVIINKVTIKE